MDTMQNIDFSKVGVLGDRFIAQLDALRDAAPIYWSETQQSWIITGHAEVAQAYSGGLPLSAGRHKIFDVILPDPAERASLLPNFLRYFQHFLINLDPPEHTRVRRLMMKAFSRQVAESYRPLARQVIAGTLDKFADGAEVEFVEEIGRPITGRNIMRIMGLDNEEFYLPKLKEWAYLANAGGSGRPSREILARTDAAYAEMAEIFLPEIHSRRGKGGEDFVSMLVNAGEGEDGFSDDELIGELILILLAGHDTTLNTMALSINALAQDDAASDHIRAHPEAILNAVMELSRYTAMSTSQARIVARDFEWQGHELKQGQIVTIMTAAANRDPRVFADPARLDLTRPQGNNVTFGPGTHVCIGHFVAKMQLTEFFPAFLARFKRFEILDPDLPFGDGLTFRGPQSMHVRLHRA